MFSVYVGYIVELDESAEMALIETGNGNVHMATLYNENMRFIIRSFR